VRIHRCPRCRAEDISTDAHPTRVLDNGVERAVFVCRNCYRAAELEFRIACQTADLGYVPLATRDGLFQLRAFYRARLDEYDDPNVLMDDVDRLAATGRIREALANVERRLEIDPTGRP
jgi:transcription elongation factor Elf1